MSTALASAVGLAAAAAPAATTGAVLAVVRFHTGTWLPVSMRWRAMAVPILPSPATPTCMRASPPCQAADHRRSKGGEKGRIGGICREYSVNRNKTVDARLEL